MNAAIRAAVRTALEAGVEPVAIKEGFRGLVEGGHFFESMNWDSVGGVMHKGSTVIGTARSDEFRTREGRLKAAHNLVENGIDHLIVVGGDGSLIAADLLHREWPGLLEELVNQGRLTREIADRHRTLSLAGLAASIDNDMAGTDMSIGADTALHRITEAVDAIGATAASHQRTFVVEVMGRHCGYLALMSGLATGADAVLIPEAPPAGETWQQILPRRLRAGREAGRRDSIVILAEGAVDSEGQPITAKQVQEVLEIHMEEDVRVTILGHVQRGGQPTAYDRMMATLLGHAAVNEVMGTAAHSAATGWCAPQPGHPPTAGRMCRRHPTGPHGHRKPRIQRGPAAARRRVFRQSRHPADPAAVTAEPAAPGPAASPAGGSFVRRTITGMNTATRAAVRIGLDEGHVMLGVHGGFRGLIDGDIEELGWMSVRGWTTAGGCELGVNRVIPRGKDYYAIARTIENLKIDGILMIGGWSGYDSCLRLTLEREAFPAFSIPIIVCPPPSTTTCRARSCRSAPTQPSTSSSGRWTGSNNRRWPRDAASWSRSWAGIAGTWR